MCVFCVLCWKRTLLSQMEDILFYITASSLVARHLGTWDIDIAPFDVCLGVCARLRTSPYQSYYCRWWALLLLLVSIGGQPEASKQTTEPTNNKEKKTTSISTSPPTQLLLALLLLLLPLIDGRLIEIVIDILPADYSCLFPFPLGLFSIFLLVLTSWLSMSVCVGFQSPFWLRLFVGFVFYPSSLSF